VARASKQIHGKEVVTIMQESVRKQLEDFKKELKDWSESCPIKNYRWQEHLSQFDLAQFLHVNKTAVQLWEQGNKPSYEHENTLRIMIKGYDSSMKAWMEVKPVFNPTTK
jgi:DNA-binding transcriptional regulator YiaG